MIKFENKSNGRFYYLSIIDDMLDSNILSVTRGGRNISVSSKIAHGSIEFLNEKIQKIKKRRLARGYTLVT